MNTAGIYERLPVFLQNEIVAHYGKKLHDMRFGGVHDQQYREILRCELMDPAEMRSHQAEKLRSVLSEAAENVPHYRPWADRLRALARSMRDPREIEILPVLEKSMVNEDPAAFYSSRKMGKRIYGNTSGTTGRPIRTLKVPESYQRNWAFLVRAKEVHGIRLGVRRASFGTRMVVPLRQTRPPFWRNEPAENNVYFSLFHMSDENLVAYHEKLLQWDPAEIVGYPSALTTFADALLGRGLSLPGKRVAFIQAETLFDWQRERIEKAFSARVVNIYGLAENVAWIGECPAGRMHVRPDYGYTEFLPVEGANPSIREIVATGLINLAMPLIRYRTGDQVMITPRDGESCPCGLRFPTVTRVIGRMDDNLLTVDGRVQTRLDGIFKAIPGVRESQIEQIEIDRFIIRVVPRDHGSKPDMLEVVRRMRRIFGPTAECEILFVERLPMTRLGKTRYQVNSIPREVLARFMKIAPAETKRAGDPVIGYDPARTGAAQTIDADPLPSSVLQDP